MKLDNDLVLVVEDDADTLELIRIVLEYALGVRVVTGENGIDALHQAEDAQPALILLDMMLPGMDGLEVAKRLRSSPRSQNTPIVAVTASASREMATAAGCNDFIQKPFQLDYLLSKVREHLPSHVQAAHC